MVDYNEQPHLNPANYQPMQGPPGAQGPAGEQGAPGIQGPVGPQGPRGVQGERGPVGPMGEIGPRGPQGEKGDTGDAGRDGAPGPQGPMGPRGFTGASGKVEFSSLNEEQLAMLKGPQGPQGERGPQGPRGYAGAAGHIGPTGLTGPMGPRGERGEQGPRGETGPMGPQGLMGPTGAPGKDGGVITKPHIATDEAWSSKDTVDYALHGKTNWAKQSTLWGDEINVNHKIADTVNGYAKNVKIYGRTMVNYSTLQRKYKETIENKPFNEAQKVVVEIFNKDKNKGLRLVGDTYTLIYTMESVVVMQGGEQQTGLFNAKVVTTKHNGETKVDFINLTTGYMKHRMTIRDLDQIDKIELIPFNATAPESYGGATVTFSAKEFMLLRADYLHKIPPEYFAGTRGVGKEVPKQPNKYTIDITSRNKNLLNEAEIYDNYYLSKDHEESGGPKGNARWRVAADPGTVATFLIHCKPETDYVFSGDVIDGDKARLVISQFTDDPYNGEPSLIDNTYTVDGLNPHHEVFKFRTASTANMIALYVGNFGASSTPGNRFINNIFDKIQLEEGTIETSYEPYRSMTKTITIDKQLYNEEYLYWDRNKNKYFIHEKNSNIPQGFDDRELTEINDEQLIHTYEGVTYVYIQSKIPSKIDAEYPTNAHNYYYTKEQSDIKIEEAKKEINDNLKSNYYKRSAWALKDDELDEGLNFLGLPNGVRIQWKRVQLMGDGQHATVDFKALGTIYTVMATAYNAEQRKSDSFAVITRVNTDEASQGSAWPKIDIWAKPIAGGQVNFPVYAQVLAVGSNETYKPPTQASNEEQEQH